MPLSRSFVFRSFLQNVSLFRVYLYCSGRVLHSHHIYSHCSGPALKHSHHTHPRYSVPVRMPPRYSVPVRMPPAPIQMPPSVCRDHHRPTFVSFFSMDRPPSLDWFTKHNRGKKSIDQSSLAPFTYDFFSLLWLSVCGYNYLFALFCSPLYFFSFSHSHDGPPSNSFCFFFANTNMEIF